MSDILRPMGSEDDEEYEGLFKSFEVEETPEPAPEPKRGGLAGILSGIKRRRDAKKKKNQPAQSTTDASDPEATLIAPRASTTAPAAIEGSLDIDAARESFLSGFEEPVTEPTIQEEKPRKKSRKKGGKFTIVQLAVLGILGLFILCVYAGLVIIVIRTLPKREATLPSEEEGSIVVITPSETEIPWSGEGIPPADIVGEPGAPTEVPVIIEEAVDATPTATPGSAKPTVSTRLDLQVFQEPNNITLRIQRGAEYLRLGAYSAAAEDFSHALALDDKRAEAYLGLGEAYFYLRRWEEAESALGSAIAFSENMEDAHFWLGMRHYYEGAYEKAAKEFDWAAELNTGNARNEVWLALASVGMDNLEEAQGATERALALNDQLPLAYVARAQVRLMEDNIEDAQGDLLYAKSLDPHNFEVLNALARFYADYVPERVVEAEQLIKQAQSWAQWDIQRAQALHTLGRIYLVQERKEDAQEVLAQASNLATVDGHVGLPGLVEDLDRTLAP